MHCGVLFFSNSEGINTPGVLKVYLHQSVSLCTIQDVRSTTEAEWKMKFQQLHESITALVVLFYSLMSWRTTASTIAWKWTVNFCQLEFESNVGALFRVVPIALLCVPTFYAKNWSFIIRVAIFSLAGKLNASVWGRPRAGDFSNLSRFVGSRIGPKIVSGGLN